ncbi:bifunctional hydroxymethylpyrimidine kinase/phosphomethylpyrimidine kinase [Blastococcus sp. Marseille-P5729]|uniref:bifunctional hydroxymethylpyrimidine kinase/phosphomethylpyrimidine kinase n=1 Tax=Blastococcus sp. Marseille-P5729 TaxID=2086582 RepID=UPI001F3CA08F|nr:bifunctional hydroxymethylpyrimidine kinase/phosphomethylpyrimidine kinase [Blastococcus sp. Marseille-P5729]
MTAARAAIPHVLTIAGSDPSGGAGVQADLKTFSALGAYGCAVLTSLTAQSTRGVTGVHVVPPEFVREQIETLVDDVRLDAVKIGMLATADVARVVTELICEGRLSNVVLDPVMVSAAGSRLLDESAIGAVRAMLPYADVLTPNLPEAAVLLDANAATTVEQMYEQARALRDLGARGVLLKGGHALGADAVDVWVDESGEQLLSAPRIDTENTHGTGCTLSSAIAALRPQRAGWPDAVRDAKQWLTGALRRSGELSIGGGAGPVHHFYELWPAPSDARSG